MATTVDRIHTKVTANTKQAQRSMRDYGKSGDKAGLSITNGFAKFGSAMAGVQSAIALVKEAFEAVDFANQMQRLRKVVGATFGDELQAATGGTISKFEAMQVASKAMAMSFQFTRENMKDVLAVSDDLGKRLGIDTKDAANQLFEALNTGRKSSLAKFGIDIEGVKGQANKTKEALRQLHEQSKKPLASDEAADNFDKFKTQLQDNTDAIKELFGTTTRTVITFFGNAIRESKGFWGEMKSQFFIADRIIEMRKKAARERLQNLAAERAFMDTVKKFGVFGGGNARARFEHSRHLEHLSLLTKGLTTSQMRLADALSRRTQKTKTKTKSGRTARRPAKRLSLEEELLPREDDFQSTLNEIGAFADAGIKKIDKDLAAVESKRKAEAQAIIDAQRAKVDAIMTEVDAWSTATDSIIRLQETLFGKSKALTILSAGIEAAKEGARAAAAFATGNIPGGIAHTAAAAQWVAVAAKAGGSAGSSGGGSRGGNRGAAGGGFSRGTGVSGGGPTVTNVYVGPGFFGDPDKLASEISNSIRGAERRGIIQPRENRVVQHA